MVDARVCVVALIGKSQLMHNQTKAWKLNSLLQKDYFKSTDSFHKNSQKTEGFSTDKDDYDDFNIETYHDIKNKVIYIHLESIYDTNNVLDTLLKSNEDKNFFELWEKENSRYVKSILLLFSVSHIIIISSPSCEFDIGYIRFFRIVDTLRNKLLPSIVDHLKSLNLPISKEWIYAGRPCSPRVLFTFENCPTEILNELDYKHGKSIEKLQHSLEDQIYNSLRKSYVITNISNNSLFAIPANQEFAYIHRLTTNSTDTNRFLLATLHKECFKPNSINTVNNNQRQYNRQNNGFNFLSDRIANHESRDADLFHKFVFDHVDTALSDGFNDNIGRTNVYPVFELAKANHWEKIFDSLCGLLLGEPKTAKIQSQYAQLKAQIDIDAQFSENRCKKQLPATLSLYQEGLPGHYTKSQHLQRLDKAIQYFNSQARGPMYNNYLKQLTIECELIWQNGRQLCEGVSLNGHPCIYELHRVPAPETDVTSTEQPTDADISEIDEEIESDARLRSQTEKSEDELKFSYSGKSRSRSMRSDSNRRDTSNQKKVDRHSSDNSRSGVKKQLPVKSHNSNIITIAASNCGEFQMERTDPFDLKEANYTFYEDFSSMAVSAKKKQIKYEFQVFNPSSDNFKAEVPADYQTTTQPFVYSDPSSLNLSQEEQFPKLSKQSNLNPVQSTVQNSSSKASKENASLSFSSPLMSENKLTRGNKNHLYTDIVVTPNEEAVSSSVLMNNQQSISPMRSNMMENLKINIEASTEIYLSGMTHSENPSGLIPRFSSWSLTSIGKNSHYNPHTGLNQPGFLPNHNYLIPWDIIITKGSISNTHTDKQNQSRRNTSGFKKNTTKSAAETPGLWSSEQSTTQSNNPAPITVRAYIGMEYECPCGHRFICSGPDRIVKVSANGVVKDDAYKLLNGDMPLYTACPCRNSKDATPYMAQMMRVFIVTPSSTTIHQTETNIDYKGSLMSCSPPTTVRNLSPGLNIQRKQNLKGSQLQIALKPKVQPNPTPCPVFWPSHNQAPIYLADNSIWVLRLPYIYMGDNEKPYYRPKDFETLNNCRVLKGMFSVILISDASN